MNPMGTAVIRAKKSQKAIASRSTWVCSSMCMSVNSSQDGHSKTGLRVFERVSLAIISAKIASAMATRISGH